MLHFKKNNNIKLFPILLGISGLVPFLSATAYVGLGYPNKYYIINLAFIYGALILSFLGALYWGFALTVLFRQLKNVKININILFIWSVIPCLFGFSYFIFDTQYIKVLIISGFIICQIVDEFINFFKVFPFWFIKLRRILTLIVVTSLFYCYINL